MTDEQIDKLVEHMVPELKIAIRGVLNGEPVHAFAVAEGVNLETGVRTRLECFLATECLAILIEAVLQGTNAAAIRGQELVRQAQEAQRSRIVMPS